MKICNKCSIEKDVTEFNKHRTQKDGHNITCRECCRISNRKRYIEKAEEIKVKVCEYRINNKDKVNATKRKANKDRPEVRKAARRRLRLSKPNLVNGWSKKFRQKNKALYAYYGANRRATQKLATPLTLTEFDHSYIKSMYIQAKELEKLDGMKRHVDHIVPLQGKNVCGLHVPWNLQILPWVENLSKGNRYEC